MIKPLKRDKNKPIDVVAVGSWTNFDHLFRVDKLPNPGDTVRITSNIDSVEKIYWGGCAPNNIVTASRLGAKSSLLSVVGEDFKTKGYFDYLKNIGVDLTGLTIVQSEHSGHSFLFSDTKGDAICISHVGVSDKQGDYEPDANILSMSKVLVCNYQFDLFTSKSAEVVHNAGGFVITSGNLATSSAYAIEILLNTDLLICTSHELDLLLEILKKNTIYSNLFDFNIQAIIETRGVKGSVIRSRDSEIKIPAIISSNVIDPVGAGDAFAGAIATGLAFGWNIINSVKLGSAVASFVVEAIGCQTNLPSLDKAVERLKQNGVYLETDTYKHKLKL